ncbi:interleukin-1 receptor-associated kinase 4-like [Brevipalpus obovatus]|uniref:interleukin-1 receptor-associated kinase 4-like n=1 Tax=Brevipalpus obovatus TaxID=246614 RepID=UPI003D9F8C47
MDPSLEARNLAPQYRRVLEDLLDINDNWRDFACNLPQPDGEDGLLITSDIMKILEEQKFSRNHGSPSRHLLDFWLTLGRKRPTIDDLVNHLVSSRQLRAADYICQEILKRPPISDSINDDDSDEYLEQTLTNDQNFKLNQLAPTAPDISSLSLDDNWLTDEVATILRKVSNVKQYDFERLGIQTGRFDDLGVDQGGQKLGEGAFGSVFLAKDPDDGKPIAVKVLRNEFGKHFVGELDVITRLRHPNLLSLHGITFGKNTLCLVYQYMPNGSLSDRLACQSGTAPIEWKLRLQIALGTAQGIKHLHDNSYIHRDIKCANILLDEHMIPKVGDFGLVRLNDTEQTTLISVPAGTSPYMPHDAFLGQISSKIDVFSFGIVLLELLTGQPPYDEDREEGDILSWARDVIDFSQIDQSNVAAILDRRAGIWDLNAAVRVMNVIVKATEEEVKERIMIKEVVNLLRDIKF